MGRPLPPKLNPAATLYPKSATSPRSLMGAAIPPATLNRACALAVASGASHSRAAVSAADIEARIWFLSWAVGNYWRHCLSLDRDAVSVLGVISVLAELVMFAGSAKFLYF